MDFFIGELMGIFAVLSVLYLIGKKKDFGENTPIDRAIVPHKTKVVPTPTVFEEQLLKQVPRVQMPAYILVAEYTYSEDFGDDINLYAVTDFSVDDHKINLPWPSDWPIVSKITEEYVQSRGFRIDKV